MVKVRPLWLWIGILFLSAIIVYVTKIKTDEVHAREMLKPISTTFMLYVPSPYELDLIVKEKDIWPRRFGPKQPPASSDLPVIYSSYLRLHPMQRDEVDFFRTLAMTASLEEWENMREVLGFKINMKVEQITPNNLLKWAQSEKCSTYGKEVAYRLAQWDPTKIKAVKELYEKCDPQSFHTLWFDVLLALQSGKKENLITLRETLQKRRQFLPNESFEFFILTQAFETLDIQLAHSK